MSDRRMLLPIDHHRRCHVCERKNDPTIALPLHLGTYTITVDACETCLRVAAAAFDVAATLRVEDAVKKRAGRRGSPS